MEKKVTKPWVKGLIISLILIVCSLATYFAGLTQNAALRWVPLVILLAGVIISCTSYANDMNGNVTFGNVFAHGFKVTAATAVIMIVYTVLALKVLFPDMMTQAMDEARKNMDARGNMTEDQINQGLEITRKFFMPIAIGAIIFIYAICGAIGGLIGAGVAKKNKDYTPLEQ